MFNTSNAALLGKLAVQLSANTSGYERDLQQAMHTTQDVAHGITSALTVAAAAVESVLIGIAVTASNSFSKVDAAMVKSTAIMVGNTKELETQMLHTAETLSVVTPTAANKAAEAYYFLASAGLSAQQSVKALASVNKFAIAGDFDLANATTLLADSQSALGLKSADATENLENMIRVSDVLLKANVLANASVEQFATALTTKTASALRLLNKDMEEGVAVLAVYANQGIKAQLAGTQFAIALREMQASALENKEAWAAMGASVYDANGKMRNIADIVEDLTVSLGSLSDAEQKEALALLGFSGESQAAIASLLGMSNEIRNFEKELRSAGGATEMVANKQMASYENRMRIVGNTVEYVSTQIGSKLYPSVVAIAEQFASLLVVVVDGEAHLTTLGSVLTNTLVPALIGTTTYLAALGITKAIVLIKAFTAQLLQARLAVVGLNTVMRLNVIFAVASAALAISAAFAMWQSNAEDVAAQMKEVNALAEAYQRIEAGTSVADDTAKWVEHWKMRRDAAKAYYDELLAQEGAVKYTTVLNPATGTPTTIPITLHVDAKELAAAESQFKGFATLVTQWQDRLSVQHYIDDANALLTSGTAGTEEYAAAVKDLTDILNNNRTESKGLVADMEEAFGMTENTRTAADALSDSFELSEAQTKALAAAIEALTAAQTELVNATPEVQKRMEALQLASDINMSSAQSEYVKTLETLGKLQAAYDVTATDAGLFESAISLTSKKLNTLEDALLGIANPFTSVRSRIDEISTALERGIIPMDVYTDLLRQIQVNSQLAFGAQYSLTDIRAVHNEISQLDGALADGLITLDQYRARVAQIAQEYSDALNDARALSVYNPNTGARETYGGSADQQGETTFGPFMPSETYLENSSEGMFSDYLSAQEETNLLAEEYERRRELILTTTQGTEEERQAMLSKLTEQYLAARTTYLQQEGQAYTNAMAAAGNSFTSSLSSMSASLKTIGGEASGAYKAMFIASQTASAAMAVVNAWLAYSQILSDPTIPYMMKPVLAGTTLAAGLLSAAAIVGTTIASFEGGGATPDGLRSGGVDGRGGMLAVLHPNEKVTDLEKEDSEQAAKSGTSIVINNNADVEVTTEQGLDNETLIEIASRKAKQDIIQDLYSWNGPVSGALKYQKVTRSTR